ncbi:hypothetical protein [Asticcacaulis machinosus]|uniref:Uncharacterized protein n=1 Tax=Asticcacaulis machinosus TaxID=2984211 RepID=A0ABT5HKT8_9CAUL|nr:hypothetical protein [Asticcacaulis machinosus]MDC7676864.1 hypothetical protein [Asticcacaulis machinosus]
MGKSIFACAVAALLASLLSTALIILVFFQDPLQTVGVKYVLSQYIVMSGFFAAFCFTALLVIGLPFQWAMAKRGLFSIKYFIIPAGVLGAILPLWFPLGMLYAPFGLLNGLMSGSLFWLIRCPDLDDKQRP